MNTSFFFSHVRVLASTSLLGLALTLTGCGEMAVNTVASRNTGIKQYNAGQFAEAAGTFRTTLRANPTDYGSCYFLGASLAKMGSYEQAVEKYRSALILMNTSIVGRSDQVFRLQCLNSLAEAFVASKDRNVQSVTVPDEAPWETQYVLAKINRGWGDADAAVDAYAQAAAQLPTDPTIAREYALYLLQLGQNDKARVELRRAYALNTQDEQLSIALRSVGVVPGPSLKNEKDIARPIIPLGPIPEVEVVIPAGDKSRSRTPATPEE